MTVKELREALAAFPDDMIVAVDDNDFEAGIGHVDIFDVWLCEKCGDPHWEGNVKSPHVMIEWSGRESPWGT